MHIQTNDPSPKNLHYLIQTLKHEAECFPSILKAAIRKDAQTVIPILLLILKNSQERRDEINRMFQQGGNP